MTSSMSEFLTGEGIIHETSCVGTPQQNGVAGRKNRDLLEKTRSLMFQMNVPKRFWSQAVLTAAYLINRLPSRILGSKSPLEILKNRKIDLSHLRVFGCLCFVHVQATQRDKFDPRVARSVFLGYSSTQKGYKCYDPKARKMVISRDVHFVETEAFFKEKSGAEFQRESPFDQVPLPIIDTIEGFYPSNTDGDGVDFRNSISHNVVGDNDISPQNEEQDDPHNMVQDVNECEATPPAPRRNPMRVRQPPTRLQDFVIYKPTHPISNCVSYKRVTPAHAAFLRTISSYSEPHNFHEANSQEIWKKAMQEELKALDQHNTWSITKLPKGKKVVGCKWIYKLKFKSDGSIERHKARLVARGFTQTFDVDYKETFAPVAKMNTVRVLLSVAVNKGWSMYQMDVKNAFLHSDLKEEVYMKLPPGHPQSNEPDLVCKLHKSIYGLKQSPRAWYAKLSSVLTSVGFKSSNADSSLFVRTGAVGKLVVLIYVDDLIITGDNADEIFNLKQSLS